MRWKLPSLLAAAIAVAATAPARAEDKKSDDGFIPLFNGKDLTGWSLPSPPSGEFEKDVVEKKNADGKVVALVGKLKKDG